MIELPQHLNIDALKEILTAGKIAYSEATQKKIQGNIEFLNSKLRSGHTYYGVNTGFGSLCDVRVPDEELSTLQENLVRSHACGMGDRVPETIVRIMMVLKLQNIAQGYSGIQLATAERLIYLYNNNIIPVVYEQGSLGASGDLAPLAHLALPLIGQGEVCYQGSIRKTAEVYQELGLEAIRLSAKEGLGLLNGTQFMGAYACWALIRSERLNLWSDSIAALSADAFNVKKEPFLAPVHRVRPHPGQVRTAATLLELLEGSEFQGDPKPQVQDPYSFRCVPQVHGATKDACAHVRNVVEIEIDSVTDNPLIFEAEDMILSGGNFHGQPLAINLDYLAIALAELANISERRTYLLVSGQRQLPPFLSPAPGVNSGMMIAQYTAAAIVSQNKQLCTPASVDSIVSSNGQEDHVSMGANAATKLKKVVDNVQRVLAIELLCAAQALDLKEKKKTAPALEKIRTAFREVVPFAEKDRLLHDDLIASENFLSSYFEEAQV